MSTLRELRAVGSATLQLPHALLRRGCHSVHAVAERNLRYPVLLVHGYAGSESVWEPARRALGAAGFGHIVSLSYNSFAVDPADVCSELTQQSFDTMRAAGSAGVHLVGHSLGGLIVRHAVTVSPMLSGVTATAVTIACPHHGAPLARVAPGRCARIMHPGALRRHAHAASVRRVRWLSYYSDGDRVVPTSSARLDDARYRATNVLIPGCGHLTICHDGRLIRSLVNELIRTESPTAPALRTRAELGRVAA